MHFPALLFITASLAALFSIRTSWLIWQVSRLTLLSSCWCMATKQPDSTRSALAELWPITYMVLELWHWDFRRYQVNLGAYDDMQAWATVQLSRTDLDWATFAVEMSDTEAPDHSNN